MQKPHYVESITTLVAALYIKQRAADLSGPVISSLINASQSDQLRVITALELLNYLHSRSPEGAESNLSTATNLLTSPTMQRGLDALVDRLRAVEQEMLNERN